MYRVRKQTGFVNQLMSSRVEEFYRQVSWIMRQRPRGGDVMEAFRPVSHYESTAEVERLRMVCDLTIWADDAEPHTAVLDGGSRLSTDTTTFQKLGHLRGSPLAAVSFGIGKQMS